MTNFKRSLATAFAAGALLVNTVLPVFAETSIVISGNGTDTENTATVGFSQTTQVVQENNADVFNKVEADADTGDNKAEDNTGGDVSIETGDADVTVKAETSVNTNSAEVGCCPGGDVEVKISGNGSGSNNDAALSLGSSVQLTQGNFADVTNLVEADADTGDNKAEDNTGGDVSIDTGNASTSVTLKTSGNSNSALVGGSGGGLGSVSAIISGNGEDSDNDIILGLGSTVFFVQENFADIFNKVDADADTGENKAEDNTGGEASIETGDAEVDVTIDNMVNFNWAAGDCGCLLEDLLVKIAGNGEDTKNKVQASFSNLLGVIQGNCGEIAQTEGGGEGKDCELDALVWADADTGDNKVEDSTGDPGGDPMIDTGDADATVEIENSGNRNVYGEAPDWELPEFDFNLNISFDLSDLLEWLLG
jgi:hypothetical protein